MLVWIASYPRSGNTFFRMLIHHLYGVSTYSVYDDPLLDRMGASDIIGHASLPCPLEELYQSDQMFLVKTHELPSDDRPAIYLVRDGRDVLVSYTKYKLKHGRNHSRTAQFIRFLRRQNLYESTLEKLITAGDKYGLWSNHVLTWLNRRGSITIPVRYEALVAAPRTSLFNAINQLNLPLIGQHQNIPSFESLHERWPDFFRKGVSGGWQEEMPEYLHELFWKYQAPAMNFLAHELDSEIA